MVRYLLLTFALLFSVTHATSQSDERKSGRIKIIPITYTDHYATTTAFGVTVDNPVDGEQVIVDVFYWDNLPGMNKKIVRSRTTVIPSMDMPVSSDPVPVALEDIMKVRVRISRVVDEGTFPYNKMEWQDSSK